MNTESLIAIPFTRAVPNVSWYRHQSWPAEQLKRFTHAHTMAQSTDGFEFFNEPDEHANLMRLNPDYEATAGEKGAH